MARVAAWTDRGRRQTNEDACCGLVADTRVGEVLMGVVCDGVGGLAQGGLASSTVIRGLCDWFERDLPALVRRMVGGFDQAVVQGSWEQVLAGLDGLLASHGASVGRPLGTTLTGVVVGGGSYLLAQVGDCRAYRIGAGGIWQLSHDQTVLQERFDRGELTSAEAIRPDAGHVLLQAMGAGRPARPVFSVGSLAPDDLLVICSDGAWRKAGDDGVLGVFRDVDHHDEAALASACHRLVASDLERGERDNLTVVCLAPGMAVGDDTVPTTVSRGGDEAPTELAGGTP